MITKLTKKQESQIEVYREEFRTIGLSTESCDRKKAEDAISNYYTYQKLEKPEFIWVKNPKEGCEVAAKILKYGKNEGVVTKTETRDQVYKASYGSFEAYWVSYYAFVAEQLPVEKDNLASIARSIVENCGLYWTFESIVVICDKPSVISMENQRLHNPAGPAIEYEGYSVYALNGIRMPEWLFTTPKDQINPKDILNIINAEIRLNAIKWYGMDKFRDILKFKVMDKQDDFGYELLEAPIEGTKQLFLKMNNPSTGEVHIEGVSPDCKTVSDALVFRLPKKLRNKYKIGSEAKARA